MDLQIVCCSNPMDIGPEAIAVFDSGIGGLTVLNNIRQHLVHGSIFYLADNGFVPYGEKTVEQIRQRCLQVVAWFAQQGFKTVVIACNTATTLAIDDLRQAFADIQFIGVEPGVKPAAEQSKNKKAIVLATQGTVTSLRYRRLVSDYAQKHQCEIISWACSDLVRAIEHSAGMYTSELDLLIDHYVDRIHQAQADTVVLGCTHFPLIKTHILHLLGQEVSVIDTSIPVAKQLIRTLERHDRLPTDAAITSLNISKSDSNYCEKLVRLASLDMVDLCLS
ncbi:MAG: glutamate racemase [Gammaproteobacteria bacterium]|nr:glutamate racemase [Gammaproteobacteria bacterium]MDH5731680.1 glutamate racemase [Gammaproteobacteria bacterium]